MDEYQLECDVYRFQMGRIINEGGLNIRPDRVGSLAWLELDKL